MIDNGNTGTAVPKNFMQVKERPYQPHCPNCGYCPHCGRSNFDQKTYTPFWQVPLTTTTAAPLNTDGTTWSKPDSLNKSTISFIDFTGAKAN